MKFCKLLIYNNLEYGVIGNTQPFGGCITSSSLVTPTIKYKKKTFKIMGSILEKYKEHAGSILEEYKKQINGDSLTEEEVLQRFKEDEKKFNKEVDNKVGEYEALDMDKFIERIGGQKTVDTMNKINEKLDRSELVNGKLVEKKQPVNENIEEWKKGFMDGFEEAYKRIYGGK